jgi:hypothetical protein
VAKRLSHRMICQRTARSAAPSDGPPGAAVVEGAIGAAQLIFQRSSDAAGICIRFERVPVRATALLNMLERAAVTAGPRGDECTDEASTVRTPLSNG